MDFALSAICSLLPSSSSSSSSSTDDDDMIAADLLVKEFSKRPQVQNFIDNVVEKYTDEEFRAQFRIKRNTADRLIERYEASTHFKKKVDCGGRKEISAKAQVLAFLWFAGNKNSYREVTNLFNFTLSSMFKIITNVLEFIFEISPNFIKFPSTDEEKIQATAKFEQIAGFPGVIGCIDGCYIYVKKPANKIRSTYINRHDLVSLTLQGICDAEKRFIDVFVGAPSKMHDARVFQHSFISDDLPGICGTQFHILGDAAYPLREYLLTPFRDTGSMTNVQRRYNKKHCQTRVKIENSFGLIKNRFRQLLRLDFHTVERMSKFILACCVLNNLCIDEGDLWDESGAEEGGAVDILTEPMFGETEATSGETSQERSQNELQRLGDIKRNSIGNMF